MFNKKNIKIDKDINHIAHKLIDICELDTAYRDIYLHRARVFFADILPYDEYHDLVKFRAFAAKLQNKISVAIEKSDWNVAKELAEKLEEIKERLEKNNTSMEIGKELYDDLDDVKISPFLSGFHHFSGIPSKLLPSMRDQLVKQLHELQEDDPSFREFYLSRHDAFLTIPFRDGEETGSEIVANDDTELREEAFDALKSGDMEHLEKIAELFLSKQKATGNKSDMVLQNDDALPGRITAFSGETLKNAKRLGLFSAHVDRSTEYSFLYRSALHPGFGDGHGKAWQAVRETGLLSSLDITDDLKRHVELFGIHTFINSGGTHYFPDFLSEDFLVEDFPELTSESEYEKSDLLSALGFNSRKDLSRKEIERALFEKGGQILEKDLGLDARVYRLVCIPPDLYLRLGKTHEWGKQKIWTHFDGYEISQRGNISALAGGDVRFGGIYDLVSIGREYNTEHLIVRFAVVQRSRMSSF